MAHLQPRDIFTQSAPRPIVIWRGILCSRICNISTAAVFAREFAPADSLSLPQPLDSVDTTGHTHSLTAPFHMECVLHDTHARANPQYFWGYVEPDCRCTRRACRALLLCVRGRDPAGAGPCFALSVPGSRKRPHTTPR